MTIDGKTLINAFEAWAPPRLAEKWDKVGLQIGTLNKDIQKMIVTLDVTEEVVDEAIAQGADLIFAHHPLIFRPLDNILTDSGSGKIIEKCLKNDLAVYVAHTNLDVAQGGMNDWLASAIGLQNTAVLVPAQSDSLVKLAVFVPVTHADQVRAALGDAGAGAIGQYSHCTFNTSGKGTFLPGEGTTPYIGETGKLEVVDEIKIETIVREADLSRVVKKMLDSHPYEEVAYDLYPLKNKEDKIGLGRVGQLSAPMTLAQLAQHVIKVFGLPGVNVVGDLNAKVQTVAVIGGSGNDFIPEAIDRGADVLVTGDTKYHNAHDAKAAGLMVIDAGHHIEKIMIQGVAAFFRDFLNTNGYTGTTVMESTTNTNPFHLVIPHEVNQ